MAAALGLLGGAGGTAAGTAGAAGTAAGTAGAAAGTAGAAGTAAGLGSSLAGYGTTALSGLANFGRGVMEGAQGLPVGQYTGGTFGLNPESVGFGLTKVPAIGGALQSGDFGSLMQQLQQMKQGPATHMAGGGQQFQNPSLGLFGGKGS